MLAPVAPRPNSSSPTGGVEAPATPAPRVVHPNDEIERRAARRAKAMPSLHQGANGGSVKTLQRLLEKGGAHPGAIDGDFGPKTKAAVAHFQKAHHLEVTGKVGQKTWAALIKSSIRRDYTFKQGQQDGAIKQAEQRLSRLGYDVGKADGYMDAQTSKAIKAYRKDEGLGTSGDLTRAVRKDLHHDVSALAHDPRRARVKATRTNRRLDAATATAAGRGDGIGVGDSGRAVKNVQAHLRSAGFDPAHVSGRFDERTAGALKAFQRKSGLPATGTVDARTWSKLKHSRMLATGATSPAQSLNERSSAVKRSEALLKKLGFHPGKVDGLFDRHTRAAVKAFERKHKRHVDGAIGTADLKKMKQVLKSRGGVGHVTATMRRLAAAGTTAAMGLGGYTSLGKCATGVSRALASAMGLSVGGNGNQIDNNLPRSKFRQIHIPLSKALKIPGLVLTWEHTSTALGSIYGHTAITRGDGHTSMSDFIETNTLAGSTGRTGLKIFMPIH